MRPMLAALTQRMRMEVLMNGLSRVYTELRIYYLLLYNVNVRVRSLLYRKRRSCRASSLNMLAQRGLARARSSPLWRRSTKARRSPDVASPWEREQGRLPRIAACGVTVEVALRHTCHAGGGSRGVDEKLDRRVGLRARLVSTALHRRRPFGEVLGWRAG